MSTCCIKSFQWSGQPKGKDLQISGRDCYVSGSSKDVAIILVHDLFGWTYSNTRLLADHFAEEVGATVYVPDFFAGEILPKEIILDQSRWAELDLPGFEARHAKEIRHPEILGFAAVIRPQYKHMAALGYCWGASGALAVAAKGVGLVDCISLAHPSNATKSEIDNVVVPVQILAPEYDPMFTKELRDYASATVPSLGLAYNLQYFPGLEHGFAIRGDPGKPNEREGLAIAKSAVVVWLRQWLVLNV